MNDLNLPALLADAVWDAECARIVLRRFIVDRQQLWKLRDQITDLQGQLAAAREEIRRYVAAKVSDDAACD